MSRFDPRTELKIGGQWIDVTEDVRHSEDITITRGVRGESSQAEAAQCSLTLNNRHGKYSPRQPASPYFGQLGRNTPLRVSLPYASSYLWIKPGDDTSQATAPDAAALGITGDIDIRVEVDAEHWFAGDLAAKFRTASNQRSWWFGVEDGRLVWTWSANGSTTVATARSTTGVPLPVERGRMAVRVTLDVNNGTGGRTTTFYTADTIAGPWTQLGSPAVNNTATTSIFDSTAPVEVGAAADVDVGDGGPIPGNYLAFELRSGIGGSAVANPNFTAQTPGDTSFPDTAAAPNTWTVSDTAEVRDRLYRFHGEISEWPPTRDASGNDKTVSIQAAGQSRRLAQGNPPLRSAMYREYANPAREGIAAYWSLEDGAGARQAAAGVPGVQPARIFGTPNMAGYSNWTASDPLPIMASGSITAFVPRYTATGEISIRKFVFVQSAVSSETSLLHVRTNGNPAQWEVRLLADGSLRTKAWDSSGAPVDDGAGPLDGAAAFGMNSRGFALLQLTLTQDGGNVDWAVSVFDFDNRDKLGDVVSVFVLSGTTAGTVGATRAIQIGREGGLTDVVVGHLVAAKETAAFGNTLGSLAAWNGEEPSARMVRLCAEEETELVLTTRGRSGNTVLLGDQLNRSLIEALAEAGDTDAGIVCEPRDWLGLGYRTRLSLYNQSPVLELSASGDLAGPLVPIDDDKGTVNDLAVQREGGSEYRLVQETGPLSVQAPPDGVGRYEGSAPVSLQHDEQLRDQAGWRLALGTFDGPRYPQVQVNLTHPTYTGDAAKTAAVLRVNVGDRVVITDPPDDVPPDDISLLVLGSTETLSPQRHLIAFNCAPEDPYQIGIYDDEGSRYDTGGSELAASGISFVQDAQTPPAGAVSSVTVSVPAGTNDDPDDNPDVMIAMIELISTTAITAPAGWTLIGTRTGGANSQIAAYYRVADNEPASYQWSWTGTFRASGWIGTYRGVDASNPIADSDSAQASTTTSIATPAVDVPEQGWLIAAVMERHAATGAAASWTSSDPDDAERVDQGSNNGSGQDTSLAVYDSNGALAAGAYTRTLTASQTVGQLAAWAVALQPDERLSVATTSGPLWTTDPAEMPFDVMIGGERITVTAITGTNSPQTFTVTRSVNGVVKEHPAGTAVTVFRPVYRAL
jgi:hypothetical protein